MYLEVPHQVIPKRRYFSRHVPRRRMHKVDGTDVDGHVGQHPLKAPGRCILLGNVGRE